MNDQLFRRNDELADVDSRRSSSSPGKLPATARLSPRILRLADSAPRGERDGNGVAAHADAAVDRAAGSSGQPLPDDVRGQFESSLDTDLSDVRVHTGAESEAAASAVGAKAYTVGNDIHFGAGQYQPMDPFGVHLLAHEVAHTVQQRGASPGPQYKLEVSTPGDAAEVEADRAADAMVAGAPASVGASSGVARQIQRQPEKKEEKKEDKDAKAKAWATEIRDKVVSVQEAAQTAMETLNADADVALKAVRSAQQSYISFEMAYNQAVGRFTVGVKKAMQAAEELRAGVKTAANVAIALFGGTAIKEGAELVGKTAEVLEKVEKAAKFLDKIQNAGKPEGPEKPEAKPDVKPGPTSQTDWRALLQTTIDSYDKYIKGNKTIASITKQCLEQTKFLNKVIDGKGGDDPQAGAEGQSATKFGAGADQAIAQLGTIGAGAVSSGASGFAAHVSQSLDKQDAKKIEQDIAIKWMSGLSKEQLSAIDDAEGYLKQLGVINAAGNRFGLDTGLYTTEWDTMVIQARAKTEQRAMQMVGSIRAWGGGTRLGGMMVGHVHGDEVSSTWWRGVGPTTLPEASEGNVRVLSYSIAPLDKQTTSNWEHVHEHDLEYKVVGAVTLTVEPV